MQKKSLLYISELFPYPPSSGGRIKSINTIQTLSERFNITLFCFSQNPIRKTHLDYMRKYTKDIHVFILPDLENAPKNNLKKLISNYLHLKPHFVYQFSSKEAKKLVNEIISTQNPVIIHIDHTSLAQYLPDKKEQSWILEEHNIEHQLALSRFNNYSKINKTKIFFFLEFLLIKIYENKVLNKFNHIFTISTLDQKFIEDNYGIANVSIQKLVYPSKTPNFKISSRNSAKKILFVGDMTWFPNINAIQWFASNVFPLIKSQVIDACLEIVGEIENDFKKDLEKTLGIRALGFQPNLDHILKSAAIFILPFHSGAGIRIKALTAWSYGLPIVSTILGMQGLNARPQIEYLRGNNPKEFADNCIDLLNNPKRRNYFGKNGNKYLKKYHSVKNNKNFLKEYLRVTRESQ